MIDGVAAALEEREPSILEPEGKHAAVALMLREREGLEVFVIKRADRVGDPWSGHMALPGGRKEPTDEDAYDTARRETIEEVGVDLSEGKLLGRLDDMGRRVEIGIATAHGDDVGEARGDAQHLGAERAVVFGDTWRDLIVQKAHQCILLPAIKVIMTRSSA